jgi:hypothetical protein
MKRMTMSAFQSTKFAHITTSVTPKIMNSWWMISSPTAHQWNGNKVFFLVQWNLGNTTWEPYSECKELAALDQYLELLGIGNNEWKKLLRKSLTANKQTSQGSNAKVPTRCITCKRT